MSLSNYIAILIKLFKIDMSIFKSIQLILI